MPRWLQILRAFAFFGGSTLAVLVVLLKALHSSPTDVNVWIDSIIGPRAHVVVLIALLAACAFFVIWHRNADSSWQRATRRR
ncbi:hypothetical protein R1A27_28240 [Methylobacterium sp. NMS12]|uniref:hypothetical protein n=1 Tax=Methylobacterium sp. NMS12 TaxID=3079766 RepID=UPI003F8822BD